MLDGPQVHERLCEQRGHLGAARVCLEHPAHRYHVTLGAGLRESFWGRFQPSFLLP